MEYLKSIEEIEKELAEGNGVASLEKEARFTPAYLSFISNKNFNNAEFRLWLALKMYVPDNSIGYFDTYKNLSEASTLSVSTIKRTLQTLEEKNAVWVVNRFNVDTKEKMSNLIVMNLLDKFKGEFQNNEVWEYIKDKYKDKTQNIKITEVNGQKKYTVV